jgi:hypothetical protein
MKPIIPVLLSLLIVLAACKGGENKADQSGDELLPKTDTTATNTPDTATTTNPASPEPEKKPTPSSGDTRGIDDAPDRAAIISGIDSHLVSSAKFTATPGGGISDCIVTVTNNLQDATFQKALVEVSIKRDDGTTVKTDYFTIVNIEPGMSKVIKVPNNTQGTKVTTAVVKVKSLELTNGEFVLAGNHSPQ